MLRPLPAFLSAVLCASFLSHGLPLAVARTDAPAAATAARKQTCVTCPSSSRPGRPADQLDGLATLGRRTRPQPFIPIQNSPFEGARVNFVSTATGSLAFAVTDLELPGLLPISFQRVYASDREDDSGLGEGWSFAFDDRLKLEGEVATLTTGAGTVVVFRREGLGHRFVPKNSDSIRHRSFETTSSDTIDEQAGGLRRTYRRFGGLYRLSRIADKNGNAVTISFDASGNVARIDNGHGALALERSGGANGRLLAIADSTGRRVSFRQDGRRLRAVVDPAGAQWTYAYAGGRLTKASDPLGRMLLRARYDAAGRAVEAGDAAGSFGYEYGQIEGVESRHTTVTDPMGAKTVFTHTAQGALAGMRDDEGQAAYVEYNEAQLPARISDSLGNDTTFHYDAQHRLLRLASNDGAEKSFAYDGRGRVTATTTGAVRTEYTLDERDNIVAARSSDESQSYEATYNARGHMMSLAAKGGRTLTFEYDANGNETAFAYSDAGRFEREFDPAGRKVAQRLPSGLTFRYEYDARGKVSKERDSAGRSVRVERDASGALTGLVAHNGQWIRAARDESGRISALANSAGKSRHFGYDARGALTDYTDARGKRHKVRYDRRGRLQSITDSEGAHLRYTYDRAGRLSDVRREAAAGGLSAHFVAAGFSPPAFALPLAQGGFGCLGGGGDGWFEGDTFNSDYGMGCGDPTGGFGGGDPFGGGGLLTGNDPHFDCALAVVECLAAVIAYVGGIGALISACGPTLGITCVGVLLAHPILGAAVALMCANASRKCRL